VPEREGEN